MKNRNNELSTINLPTWDESEIFRKYYPKSDMNSEDQLKNSLSTYSFDNEQNCTNDSLVPSKKFHIGNLSKNSLKIDALKGSNNYVNKEMLLSAFDNVLLNIAKHGASKRSYKEENNIPLPPPPNKLLNEEKSSGSHIQSTVGVPEAEYKIDIDTSNIGELAQDNSEHDEDVNYVQEGLPPTKLKKVLKSKSLSLGNNELSPTNPKKEGIYLDEYKLIELRKSCQQLKILSDCFHGIENYIDNEGDLKSKVIFTNIFSSGLQNNDTIGP